MASRDRKDSRAEREKARREERRKALSARLGGRPDQPGRSQAERDEKSRPTAGSEGSPKEPEKTAPPSSSAPAGAKPSSGSSRSRAERPKARSKPLLARLWQRREKPQKARPKAAAPPKPARTPREEPKARATEATSPRKLRKETPKETEPPKAERAEEPTRDRGKTEKESEAPRSRRSSERRRRKPKERERKPTAAKPESRTATRGRRDEKGRGEKPSRRRPERAKEDRAKALRAQAGTAAKSGSKALREGAAATRRRAKAAQPKVAQGGRKAWALAAPAVALPFLGLAYAERGARTGGRVGGRGLSAATRGLDRVLTPSRAVLLVTLATAICLIVSQFQDFRGVEVGQPGYADVSAIVGADQVDRKTPRDVHGVAQLALAGGAVLLALAAALTRRRIFGLLISAAGIAGVLVSLLVDREEGLDAGQTAIAYSGTNAVLLEAFYAQVAACGVLIAAGLLVSLYAGAEARGKARSSRRERGRSSRARPRRSLAESGT